MSGYRVADVLAAFVEALNALGPIVERVGISYRDGSSYDEWDAIQKQLLISMIGEADCLQGNATKPLSFGTFRSSYEEFSFIGVSVGDLSPKILAVVEVVAASEKFDRIVVQKLNESLTSVETISIPLLDAEFALCVNVGGALEIIEAIS